MVDLQVWLIMANGHIKTTETNSVIHVWYIKHNIIRWTKHGVGRSYVLLPVEDSAANSARLGVLDCYIQVLFLCFGIAQI